MLKSFIKVAFHTMSKNPVYSAINLFGLTIGFTACMLVAAIVWNALSYDRQWSHYRDLYRVMSASDDGKVINHDFHTLTGIGPALRLNFPQVEEYCRADKMDMNLVFNEPSDGISINCLTGDPGLLKMLDIHILEGNPWKLTTGYPNLVISKELKTQLFRNEDPIGKIVTRTSDHNMPYEGKKKKYVITGVMDNLPHNSHFFAESLLLDSPWPGEDNLNTGFGTVLPQYVLLKPGTDIRQFTAGVNHWYAGLTGNETASHSSLFFEPITDINLHPEIGNDPETTGSLENIFIYIGIAGLIMLIASFNFLNLSLAISLSRIRNIGIRSVLGAGKFQIILQCLTESLLSFLISFVTAFILFLLCLGPAGKFIGHALTLSPGQYVSLFSVCGLIMLLLISGSGLYPAWLLSRIKPVLTIRGNFTKVINTGSIRKALITAQFVISIILLCFILVVRQQLHFLNHKDLGFDKDDLLCIDNNDWGKKGQAFKQELLKIVGVTNVSISSWNPALGEGYMSADVNDPKDSAKKIKVWYIGGDYDLVSTLKFDLIKGNDLAYQQPDTSGKAPADPGKENNSGPLLITHYTATVLNINELNQPNAVLQGKPVGVLRDFNNGSLRYAMTPCVITANSSPRYGYMLIRTSGKDNPQLLNRLKTLWRQFYPDKLLQFGWTSESLALQYAEEQKLQEMFSALGLLSIILACLGLFGLVSFSIDQRFREIGIRKALGATVSGIFTLLSRAYLKLILIAIFIGSPIAFWIATNWLQGFAYRIGITWGIFIMVWIFIFFVAMFTLSFKISVAALQKPVAALKAE
jgi:putative ABC transport system permease protein